MCCSGSHLDKQLLQILLELLWVSGDGHRPDICEVGNVYHKQKLEQNEIQSA